MRARGRALDLIEIGSVVVVIVFVALCFVLLAIAVSSIDDQPQEGLVVFASFMLTLWLGRTSPRAEE